MTTFRRYMLTDLDTGFLVRSRPHPYETEGAEPWLVEMANELMPPRRPVTVTTDGYSLAVRHERQGHPPERLPLVNYYTLCDLIAAGLMTDWEPPDPPGYDEETMDPGPDERGNWSRSRARRWALQKTASSVNNLLYDRWKAVIAAADPTVVQVQRRVFAAAFGYGPVRLVQQPQFYLHTYLVKDVVNYRAAAVATFLADRWCRTNEALGTLADWKGMFAPGGASYRTLNRTLMNLPGGVCPDLLLKLRLFHLPRPIYDRLELITTCLANGGENRHPHARVLSFAPAGDIQEAMRRLSADRGQALSPRRWRHVRDWVGYLADYPDPHHGNVVTLTDRAIRYHRDGMRAAGERLMAALGHGAATAAPPVPPPDLPGVRFLTSVGQLVEEGEAMKNCIATYADRAVKGNSFLFHVEHEGEAASVEVDWRGNVVQASGPNNTGNRAAKWGEALLSKWGRQFRTAALAPHP